MKLHINKDKGKSIKRVAGIALILCMTFSMSSSHTVTEATNTVAESQVSEESIIVADAGREIDDTNMEENTDLNLKD